VLHTIQCRDGCRRFTIAGHFDKTETFAAAGIAIVDDLSGNNLPVSSEQLFKFRTVDIVTEIPHVQLLTHGSLLDGQFSVPAAGSSGTDLKRLSIQPDEPKSALTATLGSTVYHRKLTAERGFVHKLDDRSNLNSEFRNPNPRINDPMSNAQVTKDLIFTAFGHWSLGFDSGIRVSEFGFSQLVDAAETVTHSPA
jgi:hypothetical protein